MKIGIGGPGLMGSQIGVEYALAGHDVVFLVRSLEQGRNRVGTAFDLAASLSHWSDDAVAAGRERVAFVESVEEFDPDTELFLESIIEEPQAKIDLLKAAGKQMPQAILASNTSSLSIGRLGGWAGSSRRTIGTHYWNPPLLMPLVEVVAGPETDPSIVERVVTLLTDLGKRPVNVQRDVDGFVWNRLQMALLREAVWIVEQGVASPDVVDEIVRDGLARRWRYTGPFATAALGGPQTFSRVANNLWPRLSAAHHVNDLGKWLLDDRELLAQMRQARDEGLIEELRREWERDDSES
ncbi:MAG: 3-hydroxyacyl-CoA dehydrogenase family protein [Thermomicrobiales bacterium]|jgi:3-hydroxybutyryl-CoA dehydrogenase|nr:3-hydroxyacyl-CoA dehydrogenase family protein [Thermomicrobiales bacterium]